MQQLLAFFLVVSVFCLAGSPAAAEESDADGEIVVRSERSSDTPSSAVITTIELAALRARYLDGAELLEWIPGVDIRDFGGPGQPHYVQLRGASPEQVLVLVDGVRLNPILGGGADLTLAALDDVERVEVLRGPAAARFGSDGLGGVVRFVRGEASEPRTRAWLTAGSFETLRLGVALHAPVTGTADVDSGFELTTSRGDFRFRDAQRGDVLRRENNDSVLMRSRVGLSQELGAGSLAVRARLSNLRAGSPGFTEYPTPEARRAETRGAVVAQWHRPLWRGQLNVRAHERLEESRYENPEAFLGGGAFRSTSIAHGTGTELSIRQLASEKLVITGSLQGRWERVSSGSYQGRRRVVGAAQAGADWQLGPVSVGPAVRIETARGIGAQWLPSLGAQVDLGWGLRARANAGRLWRLPSLVELYHPDMELVSGNPDLRPEDGISFDAGLAWQHEWLEAEATWFGQVVRESILWAPVNAFRYRPVNTGEARVEGVELAAGIHRKNAELRASYTHLSTLRLATSNPLPARPEKCLALRARYQWRWVAGFGEVVHTGASFADFHGNLVVPGGTRVSAGVTVGPWRSVTWTLEGKNLLDAQLRDSRYFPLPGRSVYLTMFVDL